MSLVLYCLFLIAHHIFVQLDRLSLIVLYCMTPYGVNTCLRLSTTGLNPISLRDVNCLRPFKGKERNGQPEIWGYLCDHLLEKNQNVAEDIVSGALITKSFYFMLNMFWGIFNPKQVMLTIFGHSKVVKGVVNHASKGTFLIVFWSIIRMWWRALFTILWSQNPSILCWTWFLAIFQSQAGPDKKHCPSLSS